MPPLRIPSSSRYSEPIGFSSAIRAGEWVFVAGTTAADAAGNVVGGDSAYEQAREALRKIEAALHDAGTSPADVVQTRMYLTAAADWEEVGRAHGELFGEIRPAATMVVVAELLDSRMLVEIEAVARVGNGSE
jgi:enamine deaminase RidA (YjgF/YER057c/UK114 family)